MRDDTIPDATLPEPVRDHLGQQLRSALSTETATPHYLGEPVATDAFAPQIARLATRLKTHEEGTVAVEEALGRILDDLGVAPSQEPGARG